jgi:hypothetical protein
MEEISFFFQMSIFNFAKKDIEFGLSCHSRSMYKNEMTSYICISS